MSRKEEILNQAAKEQFQLYQSPEWRSGFISGAEWSDANPNLYNDEKYHTVKVSCLDELNRKAELYDVFLENACKYLMTHLWQNVDDDNDPIIESVHNITLDNFIKDFKRYLENEL